MSTAMATADAEAAPLATPKTKSGTQYNLLIDALSLARTSLAEQSRLLGDTQDRVHQLVSAQQRLQELASVEVKKRRAVAARCQELEALNSEANGDPKLLARVAELRKQIGAIVRECVSHVTSGPCIRAWHGIVRRPAAPSLPPLPPLARHDSKRRRAQMSLPCAVVPALRCAPTCGAQAVYAAEQDGAVADPAARGGRDERSVPEADRARAGKAWRGPGGAGAAGQADRGGRRRDVSPLAIPPNAGLVACMRQRRGPSPRQQPAPWQMAPAGLLGWRLLGWPSRCGIAAYPSTPPPTPLHPPSTPRPRPAPRPARRRRCPLSHAQRMHAAHVLSTCGSAAAEEMAEAREKELQAQIASMEAAEAARVEAEMAEEDSMPDAPPGPSIMVTQVRLPRQPHRTPPSPWRGVCIAPPPPVSCPQVAPPPAGPVGGFEL